MNEITPINSKGQPYKVKIDEAELKGRVDRLSFDVLRKSDTEAAFTGEYTDSESIGVYKCKACTAELFRSDTKFTPAVVGHLFINQQLKMQLS